MESRPLQIVETRDNTITLDENVLCSILKSNAIRGKYVSVISITGTFRQGKSFLLNFLLRYLQVKHIETRNGSEWLQEEDGPLSGFQWVPGSKRHTTGIVIWSEIFLTKIPSGEEVAVILLDTQGSFDNQSTIDECAKVFALSTLISSVQVFNVMRGIKQYDLTHLQCFGGYGSLLTNPDSPFQNLCFLVRDWPSPYEHPYGAMGGTTHLEEVFQTDRPELREQVDNIKSLFQRTSCFLLPYPGRAVDTAETFKGALEDIDEDFKRHVQDFVISLLAPENLIIKTINGEKVTAGELAVYLQEFTKVMQDGNLPKIQTMFKASVEAQHRLASDKAFKFYKKRMDADVKYNPRHSSEKDLYDQHANNKVVAVNYFTKMSKIDDDEIFDKHLVALKDKMDVEYKHYREMNEEKRLKYERTKERLAENIQASRNDFAGGSGLGQFSTGEKVGLAAGVIGGIAALAFGASRAFGSRGNNE